MREAHDDAFHRHPAPPPGRGRGRLAKDVRVVLLTLGAAIVAMAADATDAYSQQAPFTQYHVKAAFLYNFAKFVDWPANAFAGPESPFTLCVVGTEPFISARETLAGKSIKGRKVVVRRIDTLVGARQCHMIYLASTDDGGFSLEPAQLKAAVLTVGESEDFLRRGGIINLTVVNNKIRFEIDRDSGERLGFRFRAQLLQRALLVDSGG
jgi:hypothetical protein